MSATEKSDLPEVAKKRSNKAASAAAETVERRGGAKENADLQNTVRTQSRAAVSRAQARIREAVTRCYSACKKGSDAILVQSDFRLERQSAELEANRSWPAHTS